jgi:hypothetical protein
MYVCFAECTSLPNTKGRNMCLKSPQFLWKKPPICQLCILLYMVPSFRAEECSPNLTHTHTDHVFAYGNKAAVLTPTAIYFFILDVHMPGMFNTHISLSYSMACTPVYCSCLFWWHGFCSGHWIWYFTQYQPGKIMVYSSQKSIKTITALIFVWLVNISDSFMHTSNGARQVINLLSVQYIHTASMSLGG